MHHMAMTSCSNYCSWGEEYGTCPKPAAPSRRSPGTRDRRPLMRKSPGSGFHPLLDGPVSFPSGTWAGVVPRWQKPTVSLNDPTEPKFAPTKLGLTPLPGSPSLRATPSAPAHGGWGAAGADVTDGPNPTGWNPPAQFRLHGVC